MVISRADNNTYNITEIAECDVVDLCQAIDNAPLNLKRNLYDFKKSLEKSLAIKHQPVKK